MSSSSWNLKDNLTVDNNRFLKFLDSTGISKNNILGLNTASNLYINSANNGDIYINGTGTNTRSNTFFHSNSSGNLYVSSKLGVSISSTSNIISNLTFPINSFIGINTTQGTHTGYLGFAASSSLLNTTGSRIMLYGINNTSSSGQINLYAGNNTSGHVQIYTQNDSMKMQILHSGTANFQPNGSTIRLSVADATTTITNPLYLTSTEQSTGAGNGALVVSGGVGISGNAYINGQLIINSVTGNINFSSTQESLSYSSGATYFNGGVGIICSVGATSQTSGGALSVAGGLALGKNAILGGNITVYNSDVSTSAVTGSGIFYGGIGINGQTNIRTNVTSQIRLIPVTNGNQTSIFFGNQNDYTTSGSWTLGHNIASVGSGNFALSSANDGTYIRLISNTLFVDKYTSILNTLNLYNNSIDDLITFRTTSNNIGWSIGRILSQNDDFKISRYSSGNLINHIITSDAKTGNVNILSTENSNSSVSGGSLTVLGGASVAKDLYIGGNVYGGNINFTGSIQTNAGGGDDNIFSYLTLTSTDESLNISSGSLITFGGISIQCSSDAVSIGNGGGITIAGGASVFKSMYIGNTIASNTITSSNAFIINSTISNIINTNIVSTNITSSNITTTNLRVISQTCTTLIGTNITSTNLIITNGCIGTLRTTSIINTNITSTNNILTNITGTGAVITNITSSNTTITNSILTSGTISNAIINTATTGLLLVTSSANLRFNSNTLGNIYTTGGNVGIGTGAPRGPLQIGTSDGDKIIFAEFNSTAGSKIAHLPTWGLGYYTGRTGQTDGGFHSFYTSNTSGYQEIMRITSTGNIGIGTTSPGYTLDVIGSIRSNSNILIANTTNSITNSMGAINISGDIALSNSTRNTVIFSQAGVNPPSRTTRSLGTKLVLYPTIASNNMDYAIGVENNATWFSSNNQFKWYSNTTSANMFLTTDSLGVNTNNVAPTYNLDVIGTGRFTNSLLAQFNSNTIGNIFTTGGNVGINNISPSFTLEVSGTARITSGGFAATFNSNTIGSLFTTGGNIGIQNTSPNQRLEIGSVSYASNQDGGIRIGTNNYIGMNDASYRYIDIRLKSDVGGNFRGSIIGTLAGGIPTEYEYISFDQNGFTNIYSHTNFNNSTISTNSSTGSIVIKGGLSINCSKNSVNVSNGGALTVAGGVSIAGNLIVGGSISYADAQAASSSFAYLTLTGTDLSTNIENGSLITFGGISIQTTANAFSATEGNGLTIAGGAGIGADLYVGGVGYIPNIVSTNNSITNTIITNSTIINTITTNSTTTNLVVTNGLSSVFGSNTLGNIFTTDGNVGIGTTSPSRMVHIQGSNAIWRIDRDRDSASIQFHRFPNGDFSTPWKGFVMGVSATSANNGRFFIADYGQNVSGIALERMTINNIGNIGINTTSPTAMLDVNGTAFIRSTDDSSNSTSGAFIVNGGVSISKTTNATSTTNGGALTIAGGIGVLKDVYVGGTVTSSSDKRLKKNVRQLSFILDKIDNIQPIKYNSINDFNNRDYIGFIAQDFEEYFPEVLLRSNENAYYSLAYDRITALNMACIKELKSENRELKRRLELLELKLK